MGLDYDAIVVGGGFSGVRMLYLLRESGFSVKGIDKAGGLGGVWYENRYPGARCDSAQPSYQIQDESLLDGWTFSGRFPRQQEILEYFQYVDSRWNISRDYDFCTAVTRATFIDSDALWEIELSDGRCLRARWFISAVGFASYPAMPDVKGIDQFQGDMYHTARWPHSGVDLQGKRVAVIGTGASATQLVAEIAPIVRSLTVYQRTTPVVIPSSPEPGEHSYPYLAPLTEDGGRSAIRRSQKTFTGLDYCFIDPRSVPVGSPMRDTISEQLYKQGSVGLLWGNFQDVWYDKEANDQVYSLWAQKTRAKLQAPIHQELLAPRKLEHPMGVKRACFVDNFYEAFNLPHVELVDVRRSPLTEITKTGIQSGITYREFDIIICGTGFNTMVHGLLQMNITGKEGRRLSEVWKNETISYLGMSVHGFPNMFYLFGPQGPTVRINVPTTAECQSQWIRSTLVNLRESGLDWFEPTAEAARHWKDELMRRWKKSLYSQGVSWESRSISGGAEPIWVKGLPEYHSYLLQCRAPRFQGFVARATQHGSMEAVSTSVEGTRFNATTKRMSKL